MDESEGLHRDGSGVDKPATHKAKEGFVDIDTKALIWIFNIVAFVIHGFLLWVLSQQFDKFFVEAIKPTTATIQHNKSTTDKEIEYLKRDLSKLEQTVIKQDSKIDQTVWRLKAIE